MSLQQKDGYRNPKFTIIGTMSGTSCDGFDLCLADFELSKNKWSYSIRATAAYDFPISLQEQLKNVIHAAPNEVQQLDAYLGRWMGEKINEWIAQLHILPSSIDAIGHHGHTVFHQPQSGYSLQIGKGAYLAQLTGIDTVCDFRNSDIANGGNGAPLVPVGDKQLFPDYSHLLNIGGVCNLSIQTENTWKAGDITFANIALNRIAKLEGVPFDEDGHLARAGTIHSDLLTALNAWSYLQLPFPKSLGLEEYLTQFQPLLNNYTLSNRDLLATLAEHMAQAIGNSAGEVKSGLITGGGALNSFLVERIQNYAPNFVIADPQILEFKEALLFGFLAACYLTNTPSSFPETTGCTTPTVNGCLYLK